MAIVRDLSIPDGAIGPVHYKFWKTDTRALIGALLLAVCFSVNMQITERIDTATTGGILPWLGLTFVCLWFPAAVLAFGMTGALIVANFNPIIAVLTATGPLAPAWFAANTAWSVPFAFLVAAALRNKKYLTFRQFMGLGMIAHACSMAAMIAVWTILLSLPGSKVLIFFLWGWVMCLPGLTMGYYMCRSIAKAGVAE